MSVLEGMKPHKQQYPCRIATLKKELSDSDVAILEDALADVQTWTHYGLSKALNDRGITCNEKTIRKHRDKGCACWRT